MKQPLISVVIPVYNGSLWLSRLVTSLLSQTKAGESEFIFIDSGSTDNSISILEQLPVIVLKIPKSEFNHGETRNVGVRAARGKFVVMTVQDAIPTDNYWLENLLAGFIDEDVAGVCGIQVVPHERDKNPVAWYRPIDKGSIIRFQFSDSSDFEKITPIEKLRICSWDDVNAMYKRDILLKIPFRKVSFGEDMYWALDSIREGYGIVYNPTAKVFHYHYETEDYCFRRHFTVIYHRYNAFGFIYSKKPVDLIYILRLLRILIPIKSISWKEKMQWLRYNVMLKKQLNKAIDIFNTGFASGADRIEELHKTICGFVPVAPKPDKYEKV